MTTDITVPDITPPPSKRRTKGVSVRLYEDTWPEMIALAADDGGANYVLREMVDGYVKRRRSEQDAARAKSTKRAPRPARVDPFADA